RTHPAPGRLRRARVRGRARRDGGEGAPRHRRGPLRDPVMAERDEVREGLEKYVGKPMGPPSVAPDPVNGPMIRHWVDAIDDRNPVYLDEAAAKKSRFVVILAPPALLQALSIAGPVIEGDNHRGS